MVRLCAICIHLHTLAVCYPHIQAVFLVKKEGVNGWEGQPAFSALAKTSYVQVWVPDHSQAGASG